MALQAAISGESISIKRPGSKEPGRFFICGTCGIQCFVNKITAALASELRFNGKQTDFQHIQHRIQFKRVVFCFGQVFAAFGDSMGS